MIKRQGKVGGKLRTRYQHAPQLPELRHEFWCNVNAVVDDLTFFYQRNDGQQQYRLMRCFAAAVTGAFKPGEFFEIVV